MLDLFMFYLFFTVSCYVLQLLFFRRLKKISGFNGKLNGKRNSKEPYISFGNEKTGKVYVYDRISYTICPLVPVLHLVLIISFLGFLTENQDRFDDRIQMK